MLGKAQGYLDTCQDSYRRFDEIAESEEQQELPGDELYYEARDVVRAEGKGATSLLQRKLKIGYARAAKLMDLLEEHLVIGQADGPAPRLLLPESDEKDYGYEDGGKPSRRSVYRSLGSPHYRQHVELPSVAGLAVFLGVARSTVYAWKDDETELGKQFSDILERILAEQEKRLVNNGLSGVYNANIAKLALGKHGYTDKTDVTSGDKPIQSSPEAQAIAAAAIDGFLTKRNGNTDTPATPGE